MIRSIYKSIDLFLDKRLQLRRGERKKVLLLQLNAMILVSVLLILKPLFTSLLLTHYGMVIMPTAFILIAVSAIVVHAIIYKLTVNKSLVSSIWVNHTINILILITVGILLYKKVMNPVISLGLYIYISIFALITITFFYQYCQSLLTIREAKRVYSFIGSGAIAGGVLGGYYTSIFVPYIGSLGLVISSIVFLCVSAGIIYELHKSYKEDSDEYNSKVDESSGSKMQVYALFNPHVLNIALVIGVGVIVSKLVDYQFNYIVYQTIAEENDLTAFFGFWFSSINVLGLIIQLFVVNYVIDRLGVTSSMMIMPTLLLLGVIVMIVSPVLAGAILIKTLDGSLKQSLYKTTTEINIMPLTPSLRKRAKTLVDVVVDSLATGVAGLIVLIGVNYLDLDFRIIVGITLVFTLLWIYFAYRTKHTYTEQLSKMIIGDEIPLVESERIGTNAKKLYIDDYIRNNKLGSQNRNLILRQLIQHENPVLRRAAIIKYAKEFPSEAVKYLEDLKQDPSIIVQKAIYYTLLLAYKTPNQVDKLYNNIDARSFIILTSALAEAVGSQRKLKSTYQLHDRIDSANDKFNELNNNPLPDKLELQIFKAITISKYVQRYNLVLGAINHSIDHKRQANALRAVAYGKLGILTTSFNIESIHPTNLNLYYRTMSEFPNRLLTRLQSLKATNKKQLLKYLPACEYSESQKILNFLLSLVDTEAIRIRRRSLRIINEIRKKNPHLKYYRRKNLGRLSKEINHMKKLAACMNVYGVIMNDNTNVDNATKAKLARRSIQGQINSSILSVFILLSLLTQRSDLGAIYRAIKSDKSDAALDYLDGILNFRLRKLIMPVLEMCINRKYKNINLKRVSQRSWTLSRANRFLLRLGNEKLSDRLVTDAKVFALFTKSKKTPLTPKE